VSAIAFIELCVTQFKIFFFFLRIIASALWGWSFYVLILASYTYVEDSYDTFSASALAGLGLVRNIAGAGFPLFGRQMYERLGYEWASSLLGFLSILLVPSESFLKFFCSTLV